MKKISFIAVSLVALMLSGVAHAEIAATSYVDDAVAKKQDKLTIDTTATYSANGANNDVNIPTVKVAEEIATSALVNADWNATSGKAEILNKPTLGDLAGKSEITNDDVATNAAIAPTKIAIEKAATYEDLADGVKDERIPSVAVVEGIATSTAAAAVAGAVTNVGKTYQVKSTAAYQMGGANGTWETMSQAQQDALNSGADTTKIGKIATNETAIATLNSGETVAGSVDYKIKAAKDALTTDVDGKQTKSTAAYQMGGANGTWETMSQAQQDALNSGADTTKIGKIATNETAIATLNSGETVAGSVDYKIKAAKDALTTDVDGKQTKSTAAYQMGGANGTWETMSQAQQDALNSGADTTKIGKIATNETAIATLNSGDTVAGSVDYKIKAAKDALTVNIDAAKEAADTAQETAETAQAAADAAQETADKAVTDAANAQETADKAIPKPGVDCQYSVDGCALLFKNNTYVWEKIGR